MLTAMNTEIRNETTYLETFEALVNRYQRRLYFYALQILHNHEDAEEAVQDAFVKAYRGWAKVAAKPLHYARLRAWFFKITLNVARNRLRKKRVAQVNVDQFNGSHSWHRALEDRLSPDVIIDRHTTAKLVEQAINELPSHLFESARLRFVEGLTHSEIAERCSHPVGTVKSHVSRARRLLRQLLQPTLGSPALLIT